MKNKKIIKAIDFLIKEIEKNYIVRGGCKEINWDCPECKFRVLKGGLEYYKNLIEFEDDFQKLNKKIKNKN